MTQESFQYVGTELDVFEHATNWKRYWGASIAPSIRGDVLEVGAGTGTNTASLLTPAARSWTALEPDRSLAARIGGRLDPLALRLPVKVLVGTVGDLPSDQVFDTILYIDVLEHIDDDRGELSRAVARLRPGGRVIVLAPAHQWLYSPFDRAIGHYRRYDARMFRALAPAGARLAQLYYLDAVGLLASAANAALLRSAMPSVAQVRVWDRVFVRCSTWVDPLLGRSLGKSIVGVWERQSPP